MRVWVDMTNSPHVPFFRPLLGLLRERGAEVAVTARDYAQTLELLAAAGIEHDVVGPPHGGPRVLRKAGTMAGRLRDLRRWARGRSFELALSHASHELPLTACSLGIPSAYAFDYEFARVQHGLGCRAATRVVVPEAIPGGHLRPLGVRPAKLRRYPGLKEEYYLASFEPDASVPMALGVDGTRVLVVVRTPPDIALYHRRDNPLFADVLHRLGSDPEVQAVVLPRTTGQRADLLRLALPSLVVPERAVDAQSLVAGADLVVSAGGTMNREAVALGIPVYTTFAGRIGAVDEGLIATGRLRRLVAADELRLEKRTAEAARVRRDPAALLDLMLTALETRRV